MFVSAASAILKASFLRCRYSGLIYARLIQTPNLVERNRSFQAVIPRPVKQP